MGKWAAKAGNKLGLAFGVKLKRKLSWKTVKTYLIIKITTWNNLYELPDSAPKEIGK